MEKNADRSQREVFQCVLFPDVSLGLISFGLPDPAKASERFLHLSMQSLQRFLQAMPDLYPPQTPNFGGSELRHLPALPGFLHAPEGWSQLENRKR